MTSLDSAYFKDYFRAINGGLAPYPWQSELAERLIAGDWPGALDLPTGAGKTACLDIAIFALACQATLPAAERSVPRRLFFCVNRRVIVDEAFRRATHIARKLASAEDSAESIVGSVARRLRQVAGTGDRPDIPPLDAIELRGGIYRDNRWARSCTQPTIVCTTVDQLGSRLLFRGYGVSENAAPIHAALIAYDSLIVLDEAHISEPFRQTLETVQHHLEPEKWADVDIGPKPFMFLPMTATPSATMQKRGVTRLSAEDRHNPALGDRLQAPKPARLRSVPDIAKAAVTHATELASKEACAIGIVVNRVATARAIHKQLLKLRGQSPRKKQSLASDVAIELVIGSMRPIDRDQQAERLTPLIGSQRPRPHSKKTSIVISTQCLEVGADYDFDHIITECASIDALRQRFGRLNRSGRRHPDGRYLDADSIIMIARKDARPDEKLKDNEPLDPIYGNAMARTWNWLIEHAKREDKDGQESSIIDFGVDQFQLLLEQHGKNGSPPADLLAPSATQSAPALFAAYIDIWCQTAPRPLPEPDVSLFLHGQHPGEPDVQVCWRSDLVADDHHGTDYWPEIVALLPPTAAECMRLPISRLRRWLKSAQTQSDETGDAPSITIQPDVDKVSRSSTLLPPAVIWRGVQDSKLLESVNEIRPGDTIILPTDCEGADFLGHLPELLSSEPGGIELPDADDLPRIRDLAELASILARDRACIRVHPSLSYQLGPQFEALLKAVSQTDEKALTGRELRNFLAMAARDLDTQNRLFPIVDHLHRHPIKVEQYPDKRGLVIESKSRFRRLADWFPAFSDEGNDELSRINQGSITLSDHNLHVAEAVRNSLINLPLTERLTDALVLAAKLHDIGKADDRFQAFLNRSMRTESWLFHGAQIKPLAKSDGVPLTRSQSQNVARRAELPLGFRHEMLSLQMASLPGSILEENPTRDLSLHLIASHHGYARPFAPVVLDEELPLVKFNEHQLRHEQRAALPPPHHLDSAIAERFWDLTRQFGWWGLAYLETVLRLADWQASADESAGRYHACQKAAEEEIPHE